MRKEGAYNIENVQGDADARAVAHALSPPFQIQASRYRMNFFQTPCPIEKLPPLFFEAVVDVCQRTGAPPEVVCADSIAASNTLVHPKYKAKSWTGSLMPTAVETLSLAPTAVGKGESYRMFFQFTGGSAPDDANRTSVVTPIDDLLLQDESFSSLLEHLEGHGKCASIQLEDGFSFLAGPLTKRETISKLTQVLSGPPSLKMGRRHGRQEAFDPSVGVGLRLQPELFYDYQKRDKGISRRLGLWPRFLTFCYDPGRFPAMPNYVAPSAPRASYLPFMERLHELFPVADTPPGSDVAARKVLVMDSYANAHLRELAFWVKGQMNGEFHDIQDAAGRAAEITLRLASNFHVVCQGDGHISREMIERGWAFAYWSLGQFRNVFVHALQPPPKPMKIKPIKAPKLPHHQHTLNADMQFMLQCIGTRSFQISNGVVPQADVALFTGFSTTRFLKTRAWLEAGRLVEAKGDEISGTIRILPVQGYNAPYGYMPTA